jgi:hypothetical protein
MIRLKRRPVPQLLPSVSPQSWKTDGLGNNAGLTRNACLPLLVPTLANKLEPPAPAQNSSERHHISVAQQLQASSNQFPQSWKKTDARGKSSGSRRTQFKPGIEWNGNRGGRLRRPLTEACRKHLAKINPRTGRTNAEEIVRNMIDTATSGRPNSVRAAIAICETIDRQGFRRIYSQWNR